MASINFDGSTDPNQYDYPPPPPQNQTPAPAPTPAPSPAPTSNAFDPSKVPNGVPVEWAKNFIGNNPNDYPRLSSAYSSEVKPSNGSGGTASNGSGNGSGNGAASNGQTAQPFSNPSPMFSDPSSKLLEDYALAQFQRLQNPDPNSGTALFEAAARKLYDQLNTPQDNSGEQMFEAYAKQLVEQLKAPVYSTEDEAVIKGKAIDAIEQERADTKRQWMQEISHRNISPRSGVSLDGLLQIDNHFNSARTAFEREFAADAISKTRDNRVQVLNTLGTLSQAEQTRLNNATGRNVQALNTLGTLASSEEGRIAQALQYATIPKQLSDNSFQQGLQLVGAGGQPSSLLSSALQIAQSVAANSQLKAQQKATSIQAAFEKIGQFLN